MEQDTNTNPPDNAGNQDDLGNIENVDVRQVWRHEAHNFTPWLARNLGRLGQALHLELGPSGDTEVPVRAFSLDILAQEAGSEGRRVAIENQLAWTDHSHLGQLLTYAAGREAKVAIWVALDFRDEHKEAIRWLNRLTPEEVEFYAVKIRAIRIDDSKPAPILEPVVVPDGWPRQSQTVAKASTEDRHLYRTFTQSLREDLAKREFTGSNTGILGCHLYPELKGREVMVTLWLGHRKASEVNHIFDTLQLEQSEIERELPDGEWRWDRRGNHPYAWVWLIRPEPFSINDPPEKLDETRAWLADTVIKFKEVFNSRIEKILAEIEREGAGE